MIDQLSREIKDKIKNYNKAVIEETKKNEIDSETPPKLATSNDKITQ